MRRVVALLTVCGAWAVASSCAAIAGLGDYELAVGDASTTDAAGERPSENVGPGETGPDADDDDAASGDASGDALGTSDAADTSASGDGGILEAATDSAGDAPVVPPSNKGQVVCAGASCALPTEECCEQPDGSTCQPAQAGCGGGVIARCDEAADCLPGQLCCVTDTSAYGLETECKQNCGGSEPQSCRTDTECGGMGPCSAWTCAGSVVATCGGAGSASGCH